MYGRVKRGVVIDEGFCGNEKTTKRTHIYEDIEVGLKDWINFGRKKGSEENSPNDNQQTPKRTKRAAGLNNPKTMLDDEVDEKLANVFKPERGQENRLITNSIGYVNSTKELFQAVDKTRKINKREGERGRRRERKRGEVFLGRYLPIFNVGAAGSHTISKQVHIQSRYIQSQNFILLSQCNCLSLQTSINLMWDVGTYNIIIQSQQIYLIPFCFS
uniref:Uncharacterized protein n=1 Tax=Cacopsylla melanoneura TaxID=428564 RepID=A0A8D9AAP8_9HEMI